MRDKVTEPKMALQKITPTVFINTHHKLLYFVLISGFGQQSHCNVIKRPITVDDQPNVKKEMKPPAQLSAVFAPRRITRRR